MNKKSDTKEYILRQASEHNVKFIRLWFCDILGRLKGFAINVEDLEDCIEKGVIFDGGAIEGLARQGESDTIATPDLNTWQILPWRSDENTVARLFCNLNSLNNQEKVIDSREVLQTKLMQANKDDYKFYVSPEVEFYFLDNEKNIVDEDDAGYFDQRSVVNRGSNFRRECVLSLEEMGIPVRSSHHEVSQNQHEIGLRHTDALTMADSIITTRLVVKQTALNHEGFATFMPRPFGNLNGNGLHLYLSLYQGDKNIFSSQNTRNNLSKSGESFMAGILEYSAEMSILTNQWINSYKRLLPNLEAPVAGKDLSNSMSDIVRIPHIYKDDKNNARIEFRLPDSACNPYLTFSAILHAGLMGIKNDMKIEKRWKSNIPSSLYEAIKVSENSNFLKDAIGNQAYNSILENKEKEWIEHHSVVTDYERKYYMKFL
tara:strand:- start:81 stop:1370 length:1290 start_codon:yes stop_codon:yes gene_type:complete